jgi:hypothetical protein
VIETTSRGRHAMAELRLRAAPNIVRTIALEKVAQRWRISTPPVLAVVQTCSARPAAHKCSMVVTLALATATARPASR